MEAGSAIVLALLLLAGGGATGALVMTDAGDWIGHGMMGSDPGPRGVGYEDCPYHGDYASGECERGEDASYEECEEHDLEDCPYIEGEEYQGRGGGCCG